MKHAPKTRVAFTQDDVRLVREIGQRWDQSMERLGLAIGRSEPSKDSHYPRIANAIEAEVNGQAHQTTGPLGGFRPGDGGLVKATVPLARNSEEAAAIRDLAKRITAHVPKKMVVKNPDGSSVTVTANTISFRQTKRTGRK